MALFIKLTNVHTDEPVLVNFDCVTLVYGSAEGASVWLAGDPDTEEPLKVRESLKQIAVVIGAYSTER